MKITRQEAENILPEMWSNAVVDSDFTEEHSEYEETVKLLDMVILMMITLIRNFG
jgi:hypothetical protein